MIEPGLQPRPRRRRRRPPRTLTSSLIPITASTSCWVGLLTDAPVPIHANAQSVTLNRALSSIIIMQYTALSLLAGVAAIRCLGQ